LLFERAAVNVDKIRGSSPGDLPVEGPTACQLVINLRTARELDIAVPSALLLRADEVIRLPLGSCSSWGTRRLAARRSP
jgi:putative ABC transport system substrate-binding protein